MVGLFYDSNNESESYQAEDQFIIGTHYLVAPTFTYRATSYSVYLSKFNPGNSKQEHYYTKQIC